MTDDQRRLLDWLIAALSGSDPDCFIQENENEIIIDGRFNIEKLYAALSCRMGKTCSN